MYYDDSGYDLDDPKHPSYYERMAGAADDRRKRDRENPPADDTDKLDEDDG